MSRLRLALAPLALCLVPGCGKTPLTPVGPAAVPVAAATPAAAAPTPNPAPTATPSPAANRVPEIRFETTPAPTVGRNFTSFGPLTIQFNMCPSQDPDGDPLTFRMDLDGDGVFEVDGPTGADCRRSRRYEQSGPVSPSSFDPTICATDLLSSHALAHPYQCRTYNVKVYVR